LNSVAAFQFRDLYPLAVEQGAVGALIIGQVITVGLRFDKRVLLGSDPLRCGIESDAAVLAAANGQKTSFELEHLAGQSPAVYRQLQFHTAIIKTKGPKSSFRSPSGLSVIVSKIIQGVPTSAPE
jgi:hypothetical protein